MDKKKQQQQRQNKNSKISIENENVKYENGNSDTNWQEDHCIGKKGRKNLWNEVKEVVLVLFFLSC